MKTHYRCIFASLVALGCATTHPVELPDRLPQLIEQEPFPPMSDALFRTHHDFDLKLQIEDDGTVLRAEILNPTADSEWDSLAVSRVRRWKFSPAMHAGRPMRMWITFKASVKCEDPVFVDLAEIVLADAALADSAYALLIAGEDFEQLVSRFSVSQSKTVRGYLGAVDIHRYAEDVQKALLRLKESDITKPLAMGKRYTIFKRLRWNTRLQ